jgi:hypothetical protein
MPFLDVVQGEFDILTVLDTEIISLKPLEISRKGRILIMKLV